MNPILSAYKNRDMLKSINISDNLKKEIDNDLKLLYTFHSNKIEGNQLTLNETKVITQDKIGVSGRSIQDHMDVINHEKAINLMLDLAKNKTELSIDIIKKFNEILLTNHEKYHNHRGKFRNNHQPAIITGASSNTSLPDNIEKDLSSLLNEYNNYQKEDNKIIQAVAFFHSGFEIIHPFCDGNGRVGRLIMNMELIKNNFPLTIIYSEDRNNYYDSIDDVSKNKTLQPLTDLIAKNIVISQNKIFESINLSKDNPDNHLKKTFFQSLMKK